MRNPFLTLYDWMARHRTVLYLLLVGSIVLMALGASRIRFEENISSFFDDGSKENRQEVFDNLRLKDRIVVLLSGDDPDRLVEAGYQMTDSLSMLIDEGLILSVSGGGDEATIGATTDFIYRYLPLWLEEADYARIDSLLTADEIRRAVTRTHHLMTSATGLAVGEVMRRDPLAIGSHLLRRFERFDAGARYELYGGHLFAEDMKSLFLFVAPAFGMGNTGSNELLVSRLEEVMKAVEDSCAVEATCVGGPIVAVHNARRIKHDTALTLSLALLVIVTVLYLSFRSRRAIPLIIAPPLYGVLCALSVIGLVQGSISAIAIGSGAVVLGIALSYSIHMVAHSNHTADPRRIIEELTYPLTVGCLTTIGAFVALLFTRSSLLHDLGLFSALALVGTTLFCLIFLPHFMRAEAEKEPSALLRRIEQANRYDYARNRWAVGVVLALTVLGLFCYRRAAFDSDMANLNYVPEPIQNAEARMEQVMGDASRHIYLVSSAEDLAATVASYGRLAEEVEQMRKAGLVADFTTVADFVLSQEEQTARIDRWNRFWSDRRETTRERLHKAAREAGFREGAFTPFEALLMNDFEPCRYTAEAMGEVPVLSDWINFNEERTLLVSRIELDKEQKEEAYRRLAQVPHTSIIDRGYFSARMVENANADFNFILFISSLIVFVALMISYGRIELALLTFLPMCITWVIILGLMALFDIRFNIVNIILATFIFGIGDDFSIFIMDGLLEEYRTGRKLLGAHKTAIFFSAFTTVVGMGVLIFAKHPALRSIALISVLGMAVVVLVAYTLQPVLFRLLVTSQTERGSAPYTLRSLAVTLYAFLYFLLGCILLQLLMLVLELLPIARQRRKAVFHAALYRFTRFFLRTIPGVRHIQDNPAEEHFDRPAVIIANHQSFIDILMLLATTPRMVLVTNSWVWHSPFFGRIVRYADCYHAADGYEQLVERLRPRIEEGYSVAIFPEGTRSADCRIGRLHKGAFYLSEALQLDILPVVLYGTGMVSAKRTGFHIKRGWLVSQIQPRVTAADTTYGATLREKAKGYRRLLVAAYEALQSRYGVPENPWFRDMVVANFIYKSPVQEWYMRIKMHLDGYYRLWHRLVPRDGVVTDVGCGYGQLATMLSLLAPERIVLGLDYDEKKIDQAKHGFLCSDHLHFEVADMRTAAFPLSDAVLFNDSLHYISAEGQHAVLRRAVEALKAGGRIIVRDGDSSRESNRHEAILRTERWSTEILKFNRTEEPLHFVDREWMSRFAADAGLSIRIEKCDESTSETLYILTKPVDHV